MYGGKSTGIKSWKIWFLIPVLVPVTHTAGDILLLFLEPHFPHLENWKNSTNCLEFFKDLKINMKAISIWHSVDIQESLGWNC